MSMLIRACALSECIQHIQRQAWWGFCTIVVEAIGFNTICSHWLLVWENLVGAYCSIAKLTTDKQFFYQHHEISNPASWQTLCYSEAINYSFYTVSVYDTKNNYCPFGGNNCIKSTLSSTDMPKTIHHDLYQHRISKSRWCVGIINYRFSMIIVHSTKSNTCQFCVDWYPRSTVSSMNVPKTNTMFCAPTQNVQIKIMQCSNQIQHFHD